MSDASPTSMPPPAAAKRQLPAFALFAAIAVVAAAVRLWVLFEQREGNPLFAIAILDDRSYLDLAAAVRDGTTAGQAWFLAPLFPALLAFFGEPTLLAAAALNLVLGSLAAGAAALAARTIAGTAAGVTAGLLVALAGTFVFHDVLPGQESALLLLHGVGVLLGVRWCRSGGRADAFGLGLVTGIACMGRAISLAIALGAVVVAWRALQPRKRFVSGVLFVALGALLVLGPAAVRNQQAIGHLSPFPESGGVNLYMANGPEARDTMSFTSSELGMAPDRMRVVSQSLAERESGRPLTPAEVSDYWRRRAFDGAGQGELLLHFAKKAALVFAADEHGNNHHVSIERRWSTWLRIVPVGGWWLLAFGIGGWWLSRKRFPGVDVAAAVTAATCAALVVFYPVSRYRLPALLPAAVSAGAGVAVLLAGGVSRRRTAWAAGLLVAAGLIAHAHTLVRPPVYGAATYLNLTTALEHLDRVPEWRAIAEEALEEYPQDGHVHETLGRALLESGDTELALAHLQRADRDTRTAALAGMRAMVELGRADDAEDIGEFMLKRAPEDPRARAELYANWALAAHARERYETAESRLREAMRIMPEHRAVRHAAAVILD